jgi:hypothetical protein
VKTPPIRPCWEGTAVDDLACSRPGLAKWGLNPFGHWLASYFSGPRWHGPPRLSKAENPLASRWLVVTLITGHHGAGIEGDLIPTGSRGDVEFGVAKQAARIKFQPRSRGDRIKHDIPQT